MARDDAEIESLLVGVADDPVRRVWNSPCAELWSGRLPEVRAVASVLEQCDVDGLRVMMMRGLGGIPEPVMRLRAGALVLALMSKGIAPRWSGLIGWRGIGGLITGDRSSSRAIAFDLKLWDLIWLGVTDDEAMKLAGLNSATGMILRRAGIDAGDLRLVGCIELVTNDIKNVLRESSAMIGTEARDIRALMTVKRTPDGLRQLAEARAVRRFCLRLGRFLDARRHLARASDVHKMIDGVGLDRANLRRDEALLGGLDVPERSQ